MNNTQKQLVFYLRLAMGWVLFYAGVTKILDPDWSSAGYMSGAKTFSGFYDWLLQPNILPVVDFLNEWGLSLLGAALLAGIAIRLSTTLGAILMLLYYFPVLDFPYVAEHSYIIDEHIIYALVLLFLGAIKAGQFHSLQRWFMNLPFLQKQEKLRHWLR